ncbi:hypothetical protein DM785_02590 [Deinococcus actinosclerus]|nr:hypothetical protein DM785_02590 [Deinococcus actinosclerus]
MSDFNIPDLRKLVEDASAKKVQKLEQHTYLVNVNGVDEIIEMPTAPAQTTLGDLSSLLIVARGSHARAILVSGTQVALIMNDDNEVIQDEGDNKAGTPLHEVVGEPAPQPDGEALDRVSVDAFTGWQVMDRWTHTLPLTLHPAFEMVAAMRKPQEYGHRALIRLLRTTLAGFIDDSTLNILRALQIDGASKGTSVVSNGDSGLGRSVTQAVRTQNGQGSLPDEITLNVPVYDLRELRDQRHAIKVVLEVDPNDGDPRFTLTAVHNDVVAAQEAALNSIVEDCERSFPLVLRGALARS